MNNEAQNKKIHLTNEGGEDLGIVALEHLWRDVFALKIKLYAMNGMLVVENAIHEMINAAKAHNARIVIYRLVKGGIASKELSQLLSSLGFIKDNERIEFQKPVSDLPSDEGSPIEWRTAKQLGFTPHDIAEVLRVVGEGDPDTPPNQNPLHYIEDFLSDPILTSGLNCIHIGHLNDEVAAMMVVQRNPKTGWSRISYMGVAPKFRRQKIGNWVHRYGFTVMKREGGVIYHGGTNSTNIGMLRLFERNGCVRFCDMEEWSYLVENKMK